MNKWTDDEKKFIFDQYKTGKTIDEIFKMNKIKRSKYAIECKLYTHIYDLLQNGKTHSTLAKEFNKTKDEIKEIEKKAFEMKNQTDVKTVYTNDGGYKYNSTNSTNSNNSNNSTNSNKITDSDIFLELGKIHNVNRTMNTVLCYYENIERLNQLYKSKTIDENFYKKILLQLNEFSFDKEKILKSLNQNNEEKIDSKSNLDNSDNSDNSDDSNSEKSDDSNSEKSDDSNSEKSDKKPKKIIKENNNKKKIKEEDDDYVDEQDEILIKKFKKRII
jgi:hypothetical protein